jgi:RNA polymerase sigma-70 factor (ECF subfamily)
MVAETGLGDEELIEQVRSSRPEAFGELVRRYHPRLRTVLSYYCRAAEEVEELAQDAFVSAFEKLDQFTAGSNFYAWLRTIALNALRKEARRRSVRERHADEYLRQVRLKPLEGDPHGEATEVKAGALGRCLEQLPAEQTAALKAKYSEGASAREIAERFKRSEGAVRIWLLRIREALRRCVESRLEAMT